MIFDSHFHYAVCYKKNIVDIPQNWQGLSCAHSIDEWEIQRKAPIGVFKAFGIHPQIVGHINMIDYMTFMENLAVTRQLTAIGEAGFDFFTDEFKSFSQLQEEAWNFQLDLAIKHNLPIVVHCRKANEKLFQYSSKLKKIPKVLFHSFMGSFVEAKSLIKRNINCCFSFGKQMMNNNKKVIDCVKNLPVEHLLLETDAPFQTLKGEENTFPSDILKIYGESYKIRNEKITYENYIDLIYKNAKGFIPTI